MTDTVWTEDRTEALRGLWHAGMSATQIGRELGTSKNTIIGKVTRLGLPRRAPTPNRSKSERNMRQRIKWAETRGKPVRLKAPYVPKAEKLVLAAVVVKPPLMVSLLDVGRDQCRYPYGEPKEPNFGFCGHATRDGSSYCPAHHAVCYVPRKTEPKRIGTFESVGSVAERILAGMTVK